MSLADDIATRAQLLGKTLVSELSPLYQDGVFFANVMDTYTVNSMSVAALMATLLRYEPAGSDVADFYAKAIKAAVTRNLETNVTSPGNLFVDGGSAMFGYGQGPSRQSMGVTFSDLSSIDAVGSLGWILYQLPAGVIDDATRNLWVSVCQANCDNLDTVTQSTTFYVNGNWQCHLLNAYWLTAMASSPGVLRSKYQDMYERALIFLMNPGAINPGRWLGYGLVKDTVGSEYDWSDYLCHLTERNDNTTVPCPTPNFDPNYTALACTLLARLFGLNRDWRVNRLLNSLENKIIPLLIDTTATWVLNGTGGSRQNNNSFNFGHWLTSALIGTKSSNATILTPTKMLQLWDNAVASSTVVNATSGFYAPGQYRYLAVELASVRDIAEKAKLKVPAS